MSLILDGTNGVSDINGSAATPAIRGADANTGIFFPAVDTIAFAEDGTEVMRIDSSGNLNIGGTLGLGKVYSQTSAAGYAYYAYGNFSNGAEGGLYTGSGYLGLNAVSAHDLRFATNNTERARITSGGYFYIGVTTAPSGAGATLLYAKNVNGDYVQYNENSNASPFGLRITYSGATPNSSGNEFLTCTDTTNTKCVISSSGTISNRTGTYNAISDVKLKQDIVDAGSQWDDIKNLRVRKFRLKDEVAADPNYPAYIGLVAQEAELVSPGLIDDYPDFEEVTKTREVEKTREIEVTPAVLDEEGNVVEPAVTTTETYTETEEYTERVATGTVTKSVKYSILYMKAVKALQEAMERIEKLEAEVAAMKAANGS